MHCHMHIRYELSLVMRVMRSWKPNQFFLFDLHIIDAMSFVMCEEYSRALVVISVHRKKYTFSGTCIKCLQMFNE